ncbi:MAG: hypothetical protein M1830_007971 [Pleopsidium flavum]|nr:MAG: hypothetical protein M1830_007971 [Pleopsidium flavum]
MLLTSGQISMTISSGIVFIFTSLLFLSGYVLQQQTVRNLQAAIRPPPPPPSSTLSSSASAAASASAVAKAFGDPPGSRGRIAYEEYLVESRPTGGWKKVAYVQLVREHLHVCSAVMLFAELAKQKSKAQRVLLYPKAWNKRRDMIQEPMEPSMETSRRLLKMAADRYGVVLRAMEPMVDDPDAGLSSSAYPLAGLLSLTSYNRILYLQPSGLLLNSTKLDGLLATSSKKAWAAQPASASDAEMSTRLLLVTPSKEDFNRAHDQLVAGSISDSQLLARLMPGREPLPASPADQEYNGIVAETSYLHNQAQDLNATSFLTSTSYVYFSDPNIPGPEYDIPHRLFLQDAPSESEARRVWESMYERFRELRMNVCGLDLEPMPREEPNETSVLDTVEVELG